MKKLLLLTVALSIHLLAYSQNSRTKAGLKGKPASVWMKPAKAQNEAVINDNALSPSGSQLNAKPVQTGMHTVSTFTEATIGNTVYDLQSNRGSAKCISNNGDGTISAVWTFTPIGGSNGVDRGTGYNYFDGASWLAPPTTTTTTIRTGFTNIDVTQAGEFIVAHKDSIGLQLSQRPNKGTGIWNKDTLGSMNSAPTDKWGRMAAGGINGNTLHVIQKTGPASGIGQNSPLLYSRSTNGGATWVDDHIQIPGTGPTFMFGVGAEEYHIDARNNVVALVTGGFTTDVVLIKSFDNGLTWTRTVILPFPLGSNYNPANMNTDTTGDGIGEMIATNAGDVTVTIDTNNICHVSFSHMFVAEDAGATAENYFPTDNTGLYYWHEGMSSPIIIAAAEDFDGNGMINIPIPFDTINDVGYGLYNIGLIGQPSIGIDSNNNIYIAYSAIDELADTTAWQQALRHIFLIASPDQGLTWTKPYCLNPSPDGDFMEAVWPSVATLVDNNVHVLYQRDPAPGHSLSANLTQANNNLLSPSDLVYARITAIPGTNTVYGSCFIDLNQNGIRDTNEIGNDNLTVVTTGSYTQVSQPNNGYFYNYFGLGPTTTTLQNLLYYSYTPSQHVSNFTTYFNIDTANFALFPIPGVQDLKLSLFPISVARPGFNSTYRIVYNNIGTTTMSGSISFAHDNRQSYISSTDPVTNVSGDTLVFTYTNLAPAENRHIDITFNIAPPPTVNFGNILTLSAFIDPLATDTNGENNSMLIHQTVVGTYDPNDKTMLGGDNITPNQIANGDYLHYLIRFQNTGSDTAFTVTVRDTLSANLNWNSLEMEDASHPYNLTITNGNILKWQFNNILLPDSNVNEPASHGYICYKIKPINTLLLGATINNTAHIYFDFNQPVSTNTAHTIVSVVGLNEMSGTLAPIHIFPNPSNNSCTITALSFTNATLVLYDIAGRVLLKEKFNKQSIFDVSTLNTGLYLIAIKDKEGRSVNGKLLRE